MVIARLTSSYDLRVIICANRRRLSSCFLALHLNDSSSWKVHHVTAYLENIAVVLLFSLHVHCKAVQGGDSGTRLLPCGACGKKNDKSARQTSHHAMTYFLWVRVSRRSRTFRSDSGNSLQFLVMLVVCTPLPNRRSWTATVHIRTHPVPALQSLCQRRELGTSTLSMISCVAVLVCLLWYLCVAEKRYLLRLKYFFYFFLFF